MIREIVLDTETTGLSPQGGDRLVEIGCVELINHIPTGKTFHVYINPQRAMPEEAFRVHGLSDEFLADKPLFKAVAEDFRADDRVLREVLGNAAADHEQARGPRLDLDVGELAEVGDRVEHHVMAAALHRVDLVLDEPEARR